MAEKEIGVFIDRGPSDWQVLQQDDEGLASIDLAGRWQATDKLRWVEARVVCEANAAPATASLDWSRAEMSDDHTWRMTLRNVPAGGPYRVETRVSRRGGPDERPLRGDYVHHVGVGDLWCIAGQSNASGTGLGIVDDGPEIGVHLFANDERWKLACHPIEDATHSLHPITITGIFHGHSPWLTFAKELKRHLAVPIGLIPAALGGSSLQPWNPTENGRPVLYENMMDMIRKAGGRIKGVVWYQGESDTAAPKSETYSERFAGFVASLRKDLNAPQIPILTAQLNRRTGPTNDEVERAWTVLREQQRRAAKEIPGVFVIPTLDLPLSDEIHLSSPANVVLGQRFADVAIGKVYGHPAADTFPEIASAAFTDKERKEITLTFDHLPGGWHPLKPIEGLSVEGAGGRVAIESADFGEGRRSIVLRLSSPLDPPVTVHGAYGSTPRINLRDANQRTFVAFSLRLQ